MQGTLRRAAIVAPLRTPVGAFGGALKSVSVEALGAVVAKAVLAQTGLDPKLIDDVVFAQSYANGETPCVGRWVALQAGLPIEVPGMQLDRRCGGGLHHDRRVLEALVGGGLGVRERSGHAAPHEHPDREFVGEAWFQWLQHQGIPFHQRLKRDTRVPNSWNRMMRLDQLFGSLRPGEARHLAGRRPVWGCFVHLSALRLADGTMVHVDGFTGLVTVEQERAA